METHSDANFVITTSSSFSHTYDIVWCHWQHMLRTDVSKQIAEPILEDISARAAAFLSIIHQD